ncbi:MAG TPA: YbaB/EbfC family nucleoid-associated protein [Gemmataceae bacterium]
MFKEMGQFLSMMKNLPKLKAEMEALQQRLGQITAEGQAGGGMVTAKVNGRFEVVGCTISEEAMGLQDREMLGDLIASAVNQALAKARQAVAEESGKMAASMGLPAGMNMPLGG